ncbi:hypothetical protein Z517_06518 [Fonsecaea pedrosoi CBS 271.37]|uniref:Unplaced genomic scaffold supercont1.4, whole genome shotgun sequence n=1 Tax=Fonsecaea pedrosoi CBS 271.37 TaxID=1442368 RepID=A0A0D2GGI9_9EURO|nr:uncharacterized protein Z517_06518 [Fonsecaea pedrosoi CBS 271.37]KIW79903.1 hypothetical protein Z517_06518 [Fonsecaea pedrosoi CBS 271.37]
MSCLFCDEALISTAKFITHVSQHLERIAFAVLARPYQKWHFYEDFASEQSAAPPDTGLNAEVARLIRNNSVASVKQFLDDGILTKTHCGNSALWIAAQTGNEAIVWLLLQHGFDVHEGDPSARCKNALHYATEAGHTSVVEMLLIAGSSRSTCLDDGTTALILAAENGHASVLRILWDGHPNQLENKDLESAWVLAAANGHLECLEVMMSIFEEISRDNERFLFSPVRRFTMPSLFVRGIEAAMEKNMESSIQAALNYLENAPHISKRLETSISLRMVRWVWSCLGNSSLCHLLLSTPWLKRDWLPTNVAFPNGFTDETIRDISDVLLANLTRYKTQYAMESATVLGSHLQTLLKQHLEFIQLVYLDLARKGDRESMVALLRKKLPPHPKTLLTLVSLYSDTLVAFFIENFPSHFTENDKTKALIFALQRSRNTIVFVENGALPSAPSPAADQLLLACVKRRNTAVLQELINRSIPLFSATTVDTAKTLAADCPELLPLLSGLDSLVYAKNQKSMPAESEPLDS